MLDMSPPLFLSFSLKLAEESVGIRPDKEEPLNLGVFLMHEPRAE